MKNKEYHTVRTVQRSIEKQRIPHCQNSSKVNRETKNTTLSEQFKGQLKNFRNRGKIKPLTSKNRTTDSPGLLQ